MSKLKFIQDFIENSRGTRQEKTDALTFEDFFIRLNLVALNEIDSDSYMKIVKLEPKYSYFENLIGDNLDWDTNTKLMKKVRGALGKIYGEEFIKSNGSAEGYKSVSNKDGVEIMKSLRANLDDIGKQKISTFGGSGFALNTDPYAEKEQYDEEMDLETTRKFVEEQNRKMKFPRVVRGSDCDKCEIDKLPNQMRLEKGQTWLEIDKKNKNNIVFRVNSNGSSYLVCQSHVYALEK